ncbi:MAG: CPBP family intramembrane metalloprotease [Sinobacteraceae bacterium]|nr:CPBP family intramembrane metalloprotease [Nevskiaceae bacterium]
MLNSLIAESFSRWAAAWRDRPTNGWRIALVLLAYVGGLILVMVLANLLLIPALKSMLGTVTPYLRELVQLLILGAAFSTGLWAALRSQRALHGPRVPSLWAAPGVNARYADAVMSGVLWLLLFLLSSVITGVDEIRERLLTYSLAQWLLLGAVAVVTIGIQASSEELIFRGYLLPSLAARLSIGVTVLLSILLFTVGHPGSGIYGTLGVAAFAAVFALAVLKTGTVSYGAGAHVANNLAMFLLYPTVENADATPLDLALLSGSLVIWFLWVQRREAARH